MLKLKKLINTCIYMFVLVYSNVIISVNVKEYVCIKHAKSCRSI